MRVTNRRPSTSRRSPCRSRSISTAADGVATLIGHIGQGGRQEGDPPGPGAQHTVKRPHPLERTATPVPTSGVPAASTRPQRGPCRKGRRRGAWHGHNVELVDHVIQRKRLIPTQVVRKGPYGALQFGFEMGLGTRTFAPSALPLRAVGATPPRSRLLCRFRRPPARRSRWRGLRYRSSNDGPRLPAMERVVGRSAR